MTVRARARRDSAERLIELIDASRDILLDGSGVERCLSCALGENNALQTNHVLLVGGGSTVVDINPSQSRKLNV